MLAAAGRRRLVIRMGMDRSHSLEELDRLALGQARRCAFFHSGRRPTNRPTRRVLRGMRMVRTSSTFTSKSSSTARWISCLFARGSTANVTMLRSSRAIVLFSVTSGLRRTSMRSHGVALLASVAEAGVDRRERVPGDHQALVPEHVVDVQALGGGARRRGAGSGRRARGRASVGATTSTDASSRPRARSASSSAGSSVPRARAHRPR